MRAKKGVEGNSDASATATPCLGNIKEDDGDCTQHNNDKDTTEERSDNILSALEHPTVPDEIILEEIVWKQRGGFGKFALNLLQHEWEQRRLTLFKSGKLRYYELPSDGDMEGVKRAVLDARLPERVSAGDARLPVHVGAGHALLPVHVATLDAR